MMELLTFLLLNSLYIIGFYLAIQPGMLLEWFTRYGTRLGRCFEPIGGCVTCMASVHSWPYLVTYGFGWQWLIYICALAAVNTIIYRHTLADE